NPNFMSHLMHQTRAKSPLVLIDEADLMLRPMARMIDTAIMAKFIELQQILLDRGAATDVATEWLELSTAFAHASTRDLREDGWDFPWPDRAWVLAVQRFGRERFGKEFRFVGYDLLHFHGADVASRERLADGAVRFAAPPDLGGRYMIFS